MPRKKAKPPAQTEDLTLELARRLSRERGGGSEAGATAGSNLPEGESGARREAVDELMKRYSRSRPRRARQPSEPTET